MDTAWVEDGYGGDEEEGINTDQEDYNCSSANNFDDDWHVEAADFDSIGGDVTIYSRPQEKNYTILKEEDIRQRQEEQISEISTVLQISKEKACLLLLNYNWSVSKLHEEWFEDEERVRKAVGIVETPKVNFPGNKKFVCAICFENYTCKSLQCAGCGHLFCNSCWISYIGTAINDGPGCLTLRCPEPSCAAAVGPDMIDKLVSNKDKAKYHKFIIRSYVENSRKIKWCPAPGCDSAIEFVIGSGSYDVICDCSYGFCWTCTEESHRPVDCETVAKWIAKNSVEAENTNWILVNSKPCPKCKRPIEKYKGCNHMTCGPPCRFQFCWLCLCDLSNHMCNGYKEGKQDDVYEKKKKVIKKYLEKYTHYYERWASNNSSRRKALTDLNEMQNVHIQKLSEVQCQTESQLKFILEAWEQIVECRRVLKWTYAYGFYLSEQKMNIKLEFFEQLQGDAESGLERLHQCAEEELMKYIKSDKFSDDYNDIQTDDFDGFRAKLTGLTNATRNYFENLVRALENGLSEVSNMKVRRKEALKIEGSRNKRSKPS